MRVAVVDIGTNSTRLLIADVDDGRVTAELERRTTVTRLGAGVDADGRLRDDAMQRVYDDARRVHGEDRSPRLRPRRWRVLTSAVRDAANGSEFADTVRTRYGLEPHVLTGDEEARLTFLGATSERDPDDATPTLVVDIGGGSTELVIGPGTEVDFHVSTQAGVVRQTERHLHDDPPTRPSSARSWRDDVRAILARRRAGATAPIASRARSPSPAPPPRWPRSRSSSSPTTPTGPRLRPRQRRVRAILARLAGIPLAERRQVPGLHPDRAPTIVAGVVILLEVLRTVRARPGRGLRARHPARRRARAGRRVR